jgi:hypothetical protein
MKRVPNLSRAPDQNTGCSDHLRVASHTLVVHVPYLSPGHRSAPDSSRAGSAHGPDGGDEEHGAARVEDHLEGDRRSEPARRRQFGCSIQLFIHVQLSL